MVPVLFAAYHYGPGQEQLKLDEAARVLAEADRLAAAGDWALAVSKYEEAEARLPAGRLTAARRIRLKRTQARIFAHQLPEAHNDLHELVDELQGDRSTDPKLLAEARETQANTQFYVTWLLRLEGMQRDDWEPEIEGARQTYRLLAEQAEARGDHVNARKHRESLEGTIRLARLDLGELQGLDLPKQCQQCKNCSGRCNSKNKRKNKAPAKSEAKPKDARDASMGPPPDDSGS
jgi:hypothetical protein